MKKIVAMFVCLIIVFSCVIVTPAAGLNKYEKEIMNSLKVKIVAKGNVYSFPKSYLNQAENFFLTINVTKAQRDKIIPLIKSSFALVNKNKNQIIYGKGTKSISMMSERVKTTLLNNAVKIGMVLGLNVAYNCVELVVTRKGTNTIVFYDKPIIKVTGAEPNNLTVPITMMGAMMTLTALAFVLMKKRSAVTA